MGDPVKLTFLGSPSKNGGCPNVYATDHGTLVVQGTRITDADALQTLKERGLPDHETAVEIPLSLLAYFPKDDPA